MSSTTINRALVAPFLFLLLLSLLNFASLTKGDCCNYNPNDIRQMIADECHLQPGVVGPNEAATIANGQVPVAIPLTPQFMFQRLVEVDDVGETMTITGSFFLYFYISCIAEAAIKYNATRYVDKFWMITNTKDYWRPPFIHQNSRYDYGLTKDVFTVIGVMPFQGMLVYSVSGFFTPTCDFDFEIFPFDTQNCSIIIQLWLNSNQVSVTAAKANFQEGEEHFFVPENLEWRLLGVDGNFEIKPFPPIDFLNIEFSVKIERRPFYFLINIFATCLLLTIVQLATFFMPPEVPERASFAVTVLLGFTVMQGMVQANLPKSPENVFLSDIILGETISAMFVTFYSSITCGYVDSFEEHAEHRLTFLRGRIKIRRCRLVDFVAICVTFLVLFIFNGAMLGLMKK